MSKPINPIHWERYGSQPAKIIDLRTLPEDVKVQIIQAALNVTFHYDSGELFDLEIGSTGDDALESLSDHVAAISLHMHEVNLIPCP